MKLINGNKSTESGFSIVEMIVSMIIFLIVVGSIYGLMQAGMVDRNRASRRSDVLKNARASVHLIGRDALNAGLGYNRNGAQVPDNFVSSRLGVPADADNLPDSLSGVLGGNNIFPNDLNPDVNARTDLIAFAYRDTTFNVIPPNTTGSTLTLNDSVQAGTAVGLRTPAGAASVVKVFDLLLVETNASQVAVMATAIPSGNQINIAPGDPLGINQAYNGTGNSANLLRKCTPPTYTTNCTTYDSTFVGTMKKFHWIAYKVKQDGTLIRQIFGNNTGAGAGQQVQEMPIAYNVQDFQVTYILESGLSTDNPASGPDGVAGTADDDPSNFNLVRQIVIDVTVLSTENDEDLGKPTSIKLTAAFSTRNMKYDGA